MGSRVMTGSKAIFYLGGIKIAFASQVSFTEEITLTEVSVLDKLQVEEWSETGYRVSLQCQVFRVASQSIKALREGVGGTDETGAGGGTGGTSIMPRLEDILTSGDVTAVVIDRISGLTILQMEGVKLESRQTSVDARGLMTESWAFRGIKSSDETN